MKFAALWPVRAIRSPSRWHLFIAATALFVAGGALSYLVAPPTTEEVVVGFTSESLQAQQTDTMPSVVGLNTRTAELVLADAGLSSVEVATTTEPAAGAPERVLSQDPPFGGDVGAEITLVVSSPISMPKVTGQNYKTARSVLEELGAVVTIKLSVKPGSQAGEVLKSTPPAGETASAIIELTVADPGEAVALAELSPDDSQNCSDTSERSIGSDVFSEALSCTISEEESFAEYQIDQRALTFSFTVGLDADSGTGQGSVEVLGDGQVLERIDASSQAQTISIDVGDISSLRITVSGVPDDDDPQQLPELLLATPRLLGSADGIADLVARR